MVRGTACLITWPTRKSSKKLPPPVFDICLTKSLLGRTDRAVRPASPCSRSSDAGSAARERETTGPRKFVIGHSIPAQLQLNCKSQAMSIGATHDQVLTPAAPTGAIIHPRWVRLTHWVNAVAIVVMIGSGWEIYNASPLFPFVFPRGITLGGWLAGALLWHFAAMWLLAVNGLIYLALGIATGRFRRKLVPIRPGEVLADAKAALTGRLAHDDLSVYNAVQKLLYLGVILAGIVIVLSGLAIWKP